MVMVLCFKLNHCWTTSGAACSGVAKLSTCGVATSNHRSAFAGKALYVRRPTSNHRTAFAGKALYVRRPTSNHRTGYAAGCEARLRLAVSASLSLGLCPSFGLWPNIQGEARTWGAAPFP